MTVNDKTPGFEASARGRARLRIVGVIVLLLGIGSACMVYRIGTRAAELTDDLAMVGYNRAQSRQMGVLYGKMGLLIEDLSNDLKRPGTQAIIIGAAATLVGFGCFYFARPRGNDSEPR